MNLEKLRGKILVTGASGLVGSAVVARLLAEGWHVLYASRRSPERENERLTWVPYDLTWQSLPADFGSGAEALIHGALADASPDRTPGTDLDAARLLVGAARRSGIERRLFISSFAARADASSQYGREKYAIESFFEAPGDAIVRPGLVIGNGGLFGTLCRFLRRYRVVPLLDGGRQPLQTVSDEDLAGAIARIISAEVSGSFNVAEAVPTDYRTFWKAVARAIGVRAVFLPLPFSLAELAIRTAELFGASAFAGRERLLGLKGMRYREATSDSRVLPRPARPYDESIAMTLARAAK